MDNLWNVYSFGRVRHVYTFVKIGRDHYEEDPRKWPDGAGKTEAGKLVMQYIAAVTGHTRECQAIKYQLLQSNPVLEGDRLVEHKLKEASNLGTGGL